jgi:adenylylsulfate kinase-like enzyme
VKKGRLLWITGLSASGKTTISRLVVETLRAKGDQIVLLDGDDLRKVLGEDQSHTRSDRLRIGFVYSRLCKSLVDQGLDVIIATVALFSEIHEWNRQNIQNYNEIFIDVPIEELVRRDPKNIYKKFFDGEIKDVAGLDMEVDFPRNPHLHVTYEDGLSAEQIAKQVLSLIRNT